MGRYRVSTIGILVLIILSVPFFTYSFNISPYLYLRIKGEFDSPLLWKEAMRINFYRGWRGLPGNPTAVKPEAFYRFFSFGNRNVNLYLLLKKVYKKDKELPVTLYLNGKIIKKMILKDLEELNVVIPKGRVLSGYNYLLFKTEIPEMSGLREKVSDRIEELFSVKKIIFPDFPIKADEYSRLQKGNRLFIQPAGTFFEISVYPLNEIEIPVAFHLLKGENRGNLLTVDYFSDRQGWEPLKIFQVRRNYFKDKLVLSRKRDKKPVRLRFTFSSPSSDTFLKWDKLLINNGEKFFPVRSIVKKSGKKPNVFFILLDAARSDLIDLKVGGREVTPNLNKFFAGATNFKNFYVNAPYTFSSVTSYLTGLLPETHNVRFMGALFPDNLKTIAYYLKKSGYNSLALIGNPLVADMKLTKDFDRTVLIRRSGDKGDCKWIDSFNDVKKTIRLLKGSDYNKPGFFYIHFLPPHSPYNPPEERFKVFSKENLKLIEPKSDFNDLSSVSLNGYYKRYLDNAYYADFLVGKVLNFIRDKGIFDRSLIIIASDHGEAFLEHGYIFHGETNYSEMIKVPMAIKFPGQKQGVVKKYLCSAIDLFPSVLSYIGFKGSARSQGRNVLLPDYVKRGYTPVYVYSRAAGSYINSGIFNQKYRFLYNSGAVKLFDLGKDKSNVKDISDSKNALALFFEQKIFKVLNENISWMKIMGIDTKKAWLSEKRRRLLRSLGYL